MAIGINIDKARLIAHDVRRAVRAKEFAPLDIKVTIPGEQEAAEAARQEIRLRYAKMQLAIDAANTVAQLKAAMPQ